MKIYSKIIIVASVLFFTSCEKWLDLQPEGEATFDELYKSGDGYRSVLNGLYKSMGTGALYGLELQFGLIDCMSQQYDFTNEGLMTNDKYRKAVKYDYANSPIASTIDNIWLSAYKIIANANDLLQNIKTASPEIFRQDEMERKMIMGEAYACRALMHFDLLRLFAPAVIQNPGSESYLPYVETYPNIQASSIAVEPFLKKVIADLEEAQKLTIEYDTTEIGKKLSSTGKNRFDLDSKVGLEDEFYSGRGYRLTYYSITALLARVYQYAGMYDKAFDAASEVIGYGGETPFYKDDFSGIRIPAPGVNPAEAFKSKKDLKLASSLIFAIYNEKEYENNNLLNFFKTGMDQDDRTSNQWFVVSKDLFKNNDVDESSLDYRWVDLIFPAANSHPISGKWYLFDNAATRDKYATILPVIRATEMHYILAECYARKGQYETAYDILDALRAKRGLENRPLARTATWDAFVETLVGDARREWISEGQLFYLYKRLDAKFTIGKEYRSLTKSEYMFPIPIDQRK